jgi:hypothetical protein
MSRRQVASAWRCVTVLSVAAVLALGAAATPATAQVASETVASEKLNAAATWVPADVAFYSSMLRCGEQIQAVAKSRAWAELMAMPSVKQAIAAAKEQTENGQYAGQIQAAMKNPETHKGLAFLGDMFANEVTVFGDDGWTDMIDLFQRVQNANTVATVLQASKGPGGDREGSGHEGSAGMVLNTVAENIKLVRIPNLVLGFKLTNRDRAIEELAKLEGLVNLVAGMAAPQIADRFKREKVGQYEFLTLTLDGAMVPWDAIPLDRFKAIELHEGDADKVFDRLKKLTIVISLGVRENCLLFAIGPSTDLLARLGKGESLASRPEFKPLAPYADRRLTSISYLSKAMADRVMDNTRGIEGLLSAADKALPMSPLSEDQQKEVRKSIAEMTQDLRKIHTAPGAALAFSFLADRGIEGYSYSWADHSKLVGTKPLGLLEHVGGNPILAAVVRGKADLAAYDLLVKWAKIGKHYFDEYAVPKLPSDEARQQYAKAVELFVPLLKRLDAINRDKLFPALQDGQFAFVLDAKLKSKHFLAAAPATPEAMPMVEPALAVGVSNADLLRQWCAEYRKIANEGIAAARKLNAEIPPFEIPEPKTTKSTAGTIYYYESPKEWGLTKEIALCFGLSDSVGLVCASQQHAERLLQATPLKPIGLLKDSGPLAVAVLFDWPGLVDAATPWIELATEQVIKESEQRNRVLKSHKDPSDATKSADKKAQILAEVHTVLRVLKCFRGATAESSLEGGAMVTHSLAELKDLE